MTPDDFPPDLEQTICLDHLTGVKLHSDGSNVIRFEAWWKEHRDCPKDDVKLWGVI